MVWPKTWRTVVEIRRWQMADVSRRDFVRTGALVSVATGTTARPLFGQTPAVRHGSVRPVVIASGNGNRFKNGGTTTCVEEAFRLLTGGGDVLDALIAGVNIVERDPEDTSVGYGGLPNADGVVQLDACCMHGPKKRAGGVAGLEGVRTPSLVAKAVMEHTDHHLLVGSGAQTFARNMGFTIEADLNTPRSRQLWLEWKRRIDPQHYLDPEKRAAAGFAAGLQMVAEGLIDRDHFYGTINCDGVSPKGELAGVTTTSGLAWKIPGRVGDSPIFGAGLYVDGEVGAAGSTGRGEANLYGLCSFLIVENMRRGMTPKDAGMEALKRIKAATTERRLLNSRGEPNFNVTFYVLNAKGEHAGVALYASSTAVYAVCTENGAENRRIEPLLQGSPNA
jgi:N4-(beta-N-acetylglucosaminyl)-L-asparaginase